MNRHTGEGQAVICVLLAASIWGLVGLATRFLSALGWSTMLMAGTRNLLGALVLGAYLLAVDRDALRIAPRDLWMFLCSGFVALGCFNLCYFTAQSLTSLSVAAVILYTAPFFVIFMSRLIFGESLTASKLAACVIAFVGCAFVTGFVGGGAVSVSPRVLAVGLGSAICYALYSIFGRIALARYSVMTVTFYSLFIAGVSLCGIYLWRGEPWPTMNVASIAGALVLGVCFTALPYVLYTRGLAAIAPGKASVLAFAEPMVATIAGVCVLGEAITPEALVGIGLIFAGILILNRQSS
ncbi:MAG: EamA family transporter [Peptococcaceae bacterium]|nr:EamA family transporter [Peptococcaceae bacterium]